MTETLAGQVAVVTGSTAGIGRAIASTLAGAGAAVVVNGRTESRVAEVTRDLTESGLRATGVVADVSEPADVARLFDAACQAFGPVDVLVNNAGAVAVTDSQDMSLEQWNDVLRTNLTGPMLCSQEAARQMLPLGRGVIVNVSSIFGHGAMARRAAYTAAKHGIEGLTKALAVEWGAAGIRVCAVSPSYVLTEHIGELAEQGSIDLEIPRRRNALRRLATPDDVARAVAFVAGPEAAFLSGVSLPVDGGWLANVGW